MSYRGETEGRSDGLSGRRAVRRSRRARGKTLEPARPPVALTPPCSGVWVDGKPCRYPMLAGETSCPRCGHPARGTE